MQVEQEVTFLVNADFGEVSKVISRALIAVHTMKDEHFGISIVEMMAAGVITIADKSGGPLLDIIE